MKKAQVRNELTIKAPIDQIWALITDIHSLHKINPGVISARGSMNQLNDIRTCEIVNNGKHGTMVEKLIEIKPFEKTVWTIENDNMGMGKMLKNTRFCFYLEKISDNETKLINESYYQPANFLVSIINVLMMKKMMSKMQGQILANINRLCE